MITRRTLFAATAALPVSASGLACLAQEKPAVATIPRPPSVPLKPGERLPDEYREIDPATGMQKGYAVLSPEERAKGFVRPVRDSYTHLVCGATTSMSIDIAETFARNPQFYNATYCSKCRKHLPLDQFVWKGTSETVGG
jgi:hypothetical protein